MVSIVLKVTLLLTCCSLHKGKPVLINIKHSQLLSFLPYTVVCNSDQCTAINQSSLLENSSYQLVSQAVSDKIIFMPFYKITCNGRISTWEVQINGQGTNSVDISFTVWKPNNGSISEYSLVGKNKLHLIDVHNVTTYHLSPELEDQIDVEPGFVIGLHISNTEGPSSGVRTVHVESIEQYMTYYINYSATLGASSLLNYNTATFFKVNEIPLVSVEIGKYALHNNSINLNLLFTQNCFKQNNIIQ